ncbi:MAG: amidase [Pseudomonadota bacterium]|nr:amidase [Pseudomonadota bacterium]
MFATDMVSAIRDGHATSRNLVESSLQRIEADSALAAWTHVDAEGALARADECDKLRQSGRPLGRLHGVPVGLKDIIDVAGMPCECGAAAMKGRVPKTDARLVETLRAEGAVIIGKTVTTELAFMQPAATRNPVNPAHTPGGSSSGSAAAVAAGHVPLAVGSQTNGSVIRPASFCGTFAIKPTAGIIPRSGVLATSGTLDQMGVFGRSLEDIGLLCDVLGSYDQRDPASHARPRPLMHDGAVAEVPIEPNFLWFDMPYFDRLTPAARDGMEELLGALGDRVERIDAADSFAGFIAAQKIIHGHEYADLLGWILDESPDGLSKGSQDAIALGRTYGKAAYDEAQDMRRQAMAFFATLFTEFDAVISPAALGEAPLFETGTGDPICQTIFTLAGLPAVTLPLLVGDNDLPIGVQLAGGAEEDDRLLRTSRWLLAALAE